MHIEKLSNTSQIQKFLFLITEFLKFLIPAGIPLALRQFNKEIQSF